MLPIVPAAAEHAASFHQCLDVVAREQRYLAQVQAPPLAQVQAFVADNVARGAAQFFALDGAQVVGWADVLPHWAHALAHRGTLGMGVLPAWRGRGLGTRLLQAAIERAWANGLTRIELEARADNERAIALYRRAGFQPDGVARRAMCFSGQYFDAVRMCLLNPA